MDTLKKAKKITVKFFLNRVLESVTNEKGRASYPLYIQVTYNRKNMQLKSKYAGYYYDLKEVKPGLMEFEERILRKMITYEAGQTKGEYDLKGLKRKYDIYSESVHQAVEKYLKPKLRLAILKTNHDLTTVLDFNSSHATVARLYEAAQRLFPDFTKNLEARLHGELTTYEQFRKLYKEPFFTYTFPTVIDWVDGSYQEELTNNLKTVYKNQPDTVKAVLSLIGHTVAKRLQQLEE